MATSVAVDVAVAVVVTVEATVDVEVSEKVRVVDAATAGTVEVDVIVEVTTMVITRGGSVTVMGLPITTICLTYFTVIDLIPAYCQSNSDPIFVTFTL